MQEIFEKAIKKTSNEKFNMIYIELYNKLFKELRDNNVIKSCDFSDDLWKIDITYDNSGYENSMNFSKLSRMQKLKIKSLLINKLSKTEKRVLPETLVNRYKYVIQILEFIKEFDEKNIEEFEEFLQENYNKMSKIARIQTALFDLYEFTDDLTMIPYLEKVKEYYNDEVNTKARELPNYKSMLIFDTKINSLFESFNDEEKLKYYTLYLWWNLTTVIPLRPQEFLEIEYNCCWQDEKSEYWIKVPRHKVEDENAQIKLKYVLKTTEKMYTMIEEYKNFIQSYTSESKYLFPYELRYKSFSKMNKALADKYRKDKEKQNNNDGNLLLAYFEENYLSSEIDSEIYSHITLGDTRHYAFCNMILQGMNPLVIAQIGGHTSLKSQMHYYQQIGTCTNAYTKELSYRYLIRNHKIMTSINENNYDEYRQKTLLQLYDSKDIINFLYIDKGYCIKYKNSDNNINFKECGESCYECEYHIMDFDKNPEMKEVLRNRSDKYQNILKRQLELIKSVSKDIKIDYENEIVDTLREAQLSSTGSALKNNINKKAILDVNLLEYVLDEGRYIDGKQI